MICYVILHYMELDITISCIDHLKKCIHGDSKIIIVDNGSPNHSGEKLRHIYAADDHVIVILNNKNIGFARGNNVGYSYAKKYFSPSCMIIMNNDVMIEQRDFEDQILNYMNKQHLDVAGPDIINRKGVHQNPLWHDRMSSLLVIRRIIKICIGHLLTQSSITYTMACSLYRIYKKRKGTDTNNHVISQVSNVSLLQGACLIFGRHFIDKENVAFLPITFMYCEEDILFDYLHYKKYRMGFMLNIKVFHMDGVSTQKILSDNRKRMSFIFKNHIRSLSALLLLRVKIHFHMI